MILGDWREIMMKEATSRNLDNNVCFFVIIDFSCHAS